MGFDRLLLIERAYELTDELLKFIRCFTKDDDLLRGWARV